MRYFFIPAGSTGWYAILPGPESGYQIGDLNFSSSKLINPESDFRNNCIHCKSNVTVLPDLYDQGFTVRRSGFGYADYWYLGNKCVIGYAGIGWSGVYNDTKTPFGYHTGDAWGRSWSTVPSQFGWQYRVEEWQYDIDWANETYKARHGLSLSIIPYDSSLSDAIANPQDVELEWSDWSETCRFSSAMVIEGPSLKISWVSDYSKSMASNHAYSILKNWKETWLSLGGYGNLCQAAADNLRVDHVNLIGLTRDLIRLPHDLDSLLDFTRKSKLTHQDVASLYLSGKYGARLTIEDVVQTSKNAKSRAPMKGTASASQPNSVDICGCTVDGNQWITFDYRYDGFDQIWKRLDDASLIVSAGDLWDLVPYSFVVDWIVDISGTLDQLESQANFHRLNASNIWRSFKGSYQKRVESKKGIVIYDGTDYIRAGQNFLDQPPISLAEPTFHNHSIEASALILQKM